MRARSPSPPARNVRQRLPSLSSPTTDGDDYANEVAKSTEVAESTEQPNEVIQDHEVVGLADSLLKTCKVDDKFPCRVCGEKYPWLLKDSGTWLCTHCQNRLWDDFANENNLSWEDWHKDSVQGEFAERVVKHTTVTLGGRTL